MSKREEKGKTEQFLGSRRSELGGGEEHAGRGAKPGRRLRRHEGRLFLIFIFIFPHIHIHLDFDFTQTRVMVKESV